MQNFRQAYRPPQSEAAAQAADRMKEVELAEPWQRLLTGAINRILPIIFFILTITVGANPRYARAKLLWLYDSILIIGCLTVLSFLWQAVIMSRSGQSIGQKILRIRVITDTGENPGSVFLCCFVFAMRAAQRPGFGPHYLLCCAIAVPDYAMPQARQLSNAAGFDVADFGGEGVSAGIMKGCLNHSGSLSYYGGRI